MCGSQEFNKHKDPITYTRLVKEEGCDSLIVVEKSGFKYEYAEDGTILKQYQTDDFKNYYLILETNIEQKEDIKTVTSRQYTPDHILEFETIYNYNADGELFSQIQKNIYGEYGKLYKQPVISEQYDYRRIYTFY